MLKKTNKKQQQKTPKPPNFSSMFSEVAFGLFK